MNWGQLAYQYLIGGAFFFITLYLCFKPGAGDYGNGSDRRALRYLIIGFAGYIAMHTIWVVLASY